MGDELVMAERKQIQAGQDRLHGVLGPAEQAVVSWVIAWHAYMTCFVKGAT